MTTRKVAPCKPWTEWHRWPTLEVFPAILGKVLVHEVRGRRVSGIIIQAEAYIGEDDPACHAAPGPTRRHAPLYGPAVRPLQPLEGVALMRRRRFGVPEARLTDGPGKLTEALGLRGASATASHGRAL